MRVSAARGGGGLGRSRGRIILSDIRGAGLNLQWPGSSTAGTANHPCQFHCDAGSKPGNSTVSAPLELGPRNAQAKPRQFEPPDGHGLRLRWVSRRDGRWHSFRSSLGADGAGSAKWSTDGRKGQGARTPPGVLLRPGGLVLDGRKDHPEETLISERRKHQPLAGKLFVLTT